VVRNALRKLAELRRGIRKGKNNETDNN